MQREQRTIKKEFAVDGIGIHSGTAVTIRFLPAPVSSGIVFIRKDLGGAIVPANIASVISTNRGTTLKSGGAEISVVEHVLAALAGLGIDNVKIELSGAEPPVLDGSSKIYASLLKQAGIVCFTEKRPPIALKSPVSVSKEGASISAVPHNRFKIDFMINFPNAAIGEQSFSFEEGITDFEKEIAPARTFGFLEEMDALKAAGLGRGASLDNALGLTHEGYLNEPLWPDEPVRHKVLDLIGDLSLLGGYLKAHITAKRSGHEMNIALAKEILKNSA